MHLTWPDSLLSIFHLFFLSPGEVTGMVVEVRNLIPKAQAGNQRFEDIEHIFTSENMPIFLYETPLYTFIRGALTDKYNYTSSVRIDVINGVHQPSHDYFHFNIRVYDTSKKRNVSERVTHDNLHVYVIPLIIADELGNPILTWHLNPDLLITE